MNSLTIGQLAKRANVNIDIIRYYEMRILTIEFSALYFFWLIY